MLSMELVEAIGRSGAEMRQADVYWEHGYHVFKERIDSILLSWSIVEDEKVWNLSEKLEKAVARLERESHGWRSAVNMVREGRKIDGARLKAQMAHFRKSTKKVYDQLMRLDDMVKRTGDVAWGDEQQRMQDLRVAYGTMADHEKFVLALA